MTSAVARDGVFLGDVFGEGLLSPFAVCSSAASADLVLSVPDDPCGAPDEFSLRVALFGLKPQSGAFAARGIVPSSRSMFRSVVNSLPAIL